MTQETNTPTPLSIGEYYEHQIVSESYGGAIAVVYNPYEHQATERPEVYAEGEKLQKEWAAFIVRACNAHDELVAMLKRLLSVEAEHGAYEYSSSDLFGDSCGNTDEYNQLLKDAAQLLAKIGEA